MNPAGLKQKQALPPMLMQDTLNSKEESAKQRRVITAATLGLSLLLLATLVTVMLVWTRQPKAPVWLKHSTVIHSVTSEDKSTQAQACREHHGTASDWFDSATVEMTSVVLSITNEVRILVLPGSLELNHLLSEASTAKANRQNKTNNYTSTETETETKEIAMMIVTADRKTGDLLTMQTSKSAEEEVQFINTALLVVQQLLVDTTAIVLTSEAASRKRRAVSESESNCDHMTSFGSTEYCKSTVRVNDKANDREVYRKQYSNHAKSNRHKRDTVDSRLHHQVNVEVDSFVSQDSGMLEEGYVTASATLNVFADESQSKKIELRRQLKTNFTVNRFGISEHSLTYLHELLLRTNLSTYDQSPLDINRNNANATNNTDESLRKKRDVSISKQFEFELLNLFGQSVRVVADASLTYCKAEGDFSLYIGPMKFTIARKEVQCSNRSFADTLDFGSHIADFYLAVVPTPVGAITVYATVTFSASIHGAITPALTLVSASVRPQASAAVSVSAGWNFVIGEVGVAASVDTAVQFPVLVSFDLNNLTTSISGQLTYSTNGAVGLYYKMIYVQLKCWKLAFVHVCHPWPSLTNASYIFSGSIAGNGTINMW